MLTKDDHVDSVVESVTDKYQENVHELGQLFLTGKNSYNYRFDQLRRMVSIYGRADDFRMEKHAANLFAREQQNYRFYLGLPWCIQECTYCDLSDGIYPSLGVMHDYLAATIKEIELLLSLGLKDHRLLSLYFGGGTPSILNSKQLSEYLQQVFDILPLKEKSVSTIEISCSTITDKKIEIIQKYFKRVSMGIQVTDSSVRHSLGRILNREALLRKLATVTQNIELVNVDLIYGFRGQTVKDFIKSVGDMIDSDVSSMTLYRLELFQGTPMYANYEREGSRDIEDEKYLMHYLAAKTLLESSGYVESPLGWFVKKEKLQDNLKKSDWDNFINAWSQRMPYLGIGPGAYTYSEDFWALNAADLESWKKAVKRERVPIDLITIYDDRMIFLYKLMRLLRMNAELDLHYLEKLWPGNRSDLYCVFNILSDNKLMVEENKKMRLTVIGTAVITRIIECIVDFLLGTDNA